MKPTDALMSLWQFIPVVIAEANRTGQEQELEFNGTKVRVYPGSHEYDIGDKWVLKREYDRHGRGGA